MSDEPPGATSTRFHQCFVRSSPREQQSTGQFRYDGFESPAVHYNWQIKASLTARGCRLALIGLFPGLKKCPLDTFLPRYARSPSSSPLLIPKRNSTQIGAVPFWCGQQDSNLHALAVEPKSTESTNSTMPAYSFAPLIFTRRGIRLKNKRTCYCQNTINIIEQ